MLICIGILNRLLIVRGIMDGCVHGQNVYPGARPMGVAEQRERERRGPAVQRRLRRERWSQLCYAEPVASCGV